MPKQELALGELGDISYTAIRKGGKITGYRARARWRRPTDGEILPKERSGKSKGAAKTALKKYVTELNEYAAGGSETITRDTKIPVLADLWLAECELDEGMDDASVERYREEIEPTEMRYRKDGSPDRRVKPDALKIKTAFANISVWELNTPRYDRHEKAILATGAKQKARFHRIIVSGMMDLAVRHGAIKPGDHPVRSLKAIRRERKNPRALEQGQLSELRAQLRAWLRGEAIEGTEAYTHGPARDPDVVRIGDLMLATGARPGEVLGFRKCDIHLPASPGDPWLVDVFGTVKPDRNGKLNRVPHTKTGEDGKRTVILPKFGVAVLAEMGAYEWEPGDESPVFPSRAGTWRWPANFRRSWREARGSKFAWVEPKTFRKTVATVIADEYGHERAGAQLGHTPGSKVTQLSYIQRALLVADSTPALDRFSEIPAVTEEVEVLDMGESDGETVG
ncbi:tyrosine-type recombinase/integrase [Nocardia flavorosea]|uniref:Phage integrase family protein n=1 Tax=Nocardia flavorosea TaxID=53429 RepID=A0A846YMA0_9NOCA|nr:hypothetical protein [Nocardia flavorosea]NKY60806.1 hypothetical protein [Nocardia flavorosea]